MIYTAQVVANWFIYHYWWRQIYGGWSHYWWRQISCNVNERYRVCLYQTPMSAFLNFNLKSFAVNHEMKSLFVFKVNQNLI